MKILLAFVLSCCFVAPSFAATLLWDSQPTSGGALIVEKGTTPTGPFTTVATLPQGTTQYVLTPGAWGFYRVRNSIGPSNVVQFSLDQYTGDVTIRLDALETADVAFKATDASITKSVIDLQSNLTVLMDRVGVLESVPIVAPPPPATGNLSAKQIDADHVEVVGTNCVSLKTTGTGLKRIVECVH